MWSLHGATLVSHSESIRIQLNPTSTSEAYNHLSQTCVMSIPVVTGMTQGHTMRKGAPGGDQGQRF